MKLKYLFLTLFLPLALGTDLHAQSQNCGAVEFMEYQKQIDPNISLKIQEIEKHTNAHLHGEKSVSGVITIPVVFHVLWTYENQNISDAQVLSQLEVLNEDFRRMNADAANTPADFLGVAGDVEIEFCLATVDPDGNPTTGIIRTYTEKFFFNYPQESHLVYSNSTGGSDIWPASDYLNFYIANINGASGYAPYPGGNPARDAVVVKTTLTGRGFGSSLGRTGTHEVGHWLNLRHIWGDGNCNVDDLVADTPTASDANFTSAPCTYPGPNSCDDGPGDLPDMFQNYMDYSKDFCMNLFTQGQGARMRVLFEPGGPRASLLNSNGCGVSCVEPVAMCNDVTVQLDASGDGTVDASMVGAGSTADCGLASETVVPSSFDCDDVGPNTVTYTITDTNGASSSCTAVITVEDNIAPTAVCQDATVVLNGTSATLTAGQVDGGSTDNCPPPAVSVSPTMFDCDDVGANPVTLLVVETSGGTGFSTCTATVTVQDNLLPTANCTPATIQVGDMLMPSQVDNGSLDNCTNPPDLSVSPNTFGCGNVGPNTVTLTADDTNGNTATCSALVTVESNAPPTAVCANFTTNIIVDGHMAFINPNDIDGGSSSVCSTVSLGVSPTNFTCSDVGPNTVTLTATDDGNSLTATCTAVVTVEDPSSLCCAGPVAMCNAVTVQLDNLGNGTADASAVGAGSTADCGLASETVMPSSFDCDDVGPNTVTYTITDINGASSSCTSIVTVEDNVPPVAKCQDATVQLDVNGDATLLATTVDNGSTDACGVASVSVSPAFFSCSDLGGNTVTLEVTDNNSNSSTCTATATVEDNIRPSISCPPAATFNNDPGSCESTFTVPLATASDNCAVTVLRYRWREVDALGNHITASWSIWSSAVMQTLPVGHWKIQWQAKDASNNQRKCSFLVDIVDNEPPNAVCNDLTVEFNGEQEIMLTAADVYNDVASSDNCGIVILMGYSPSSVTCDQLGTVVPVTVMVEDDSGNPSQCTANVTVGGLPCGWSAGPDGINCPDGNEASYDPNADTFMVTSEGCYDPNYYSNSDSHGFTGTQLCGDGEIIAEILGISGDGFAGISMREDLNAGAKMLQLSIDGVSLTKRELRQSTGGIAFNHLFQTLGKNWLRLTRSGNQFTAQHSMDGVNWASVIITNIAMASCIEIGLITENNSPSGTATGTFANVEIKSANGLISPPTNGGVVIAESQRNASVTIFPNPTSGEVLIDLGAYIGQKATIQVFNNLGQSVKLMEVEEFQFPTQRLDLSGYQNGMYFIKIQIPDHPEVTRKLMLIGER